MEPQLPETLDICYSPRNSPDSLNDGIAVPDNISGRASAVTESSPGSTDFTGKGDRDGTDVDDPRDELSLSSLPAVQSHSTYSHWSQPWSIDKEVKPKEHKFYGGLNSSGPDPDWTDTWSHDNGSDHHFSGTSGLDWNTWKLESKWEANPMILEWPEVNPQEVELDAIPLFSLIDEWKQEDEEEQAAIEDNNLINSFFLDDDKPLLVGGGLSNLGNTCFLNAVLQCLMHIVPLVQSIEAYNHPSPCEACNEGFCVLCDLKELIMHTTLASKGSNVHPWRFVNNLKYFSSSFQRHQQEDAHEFLLFFLDRLERSCSNQKLEGQVYPNHENFVKQTFGGHLISKLQCFNCGHCSKTYEPLVDLSLEIEDVGSLPMALDSFTKIEKIEDPMAKFTCEKCKVQVSMEKQLLLDEAPLVATFHLKRFKNVGSLVEKIDKHITFPLELDLLPYVERDKKVDASKYNLVAVLVHFGLSLYSGHYYCFIHSSPNEWYKFDDSKVTQVQEDFVMSQSAYILFYVRQGTPWFSEFIQTKQPILDESISNSSPKPASNNGDPISSPSSKMDSDGSKHNGIGTSEGHENLDDSAAQEGTHNSSDICSAEAEKSPPRSVLKEINNKQESGIAKRSEDSTTKTLSRSPSPETHREDTTDICSAEAEAEAEKSPPRSVLKEINNKQESGIAKRSGDSTTKTLSRSPSPEAHREDTTDEVSCKDELQDRKQACSLVKKKAYSEGCNMKKRRRMEVSPVRDGGSLTSRRRSNSSLRLRPLSAINLR